jgi:hypothetical protein
MPTFKSTVALILRAYLLLLLLFCLALLCCFFVKATFVAIGFH